MLPTLDMQKDSKSDQILQNSNQKDYVSMFYQRVSPRRKKYAHDQDNMHSAPRNLLIKAETMYKLNLLAFVSQCYRDLYTFLLSLNPAFFLFLFPLI